MDNGARIVKINRNREQQMNKNIIRMNNTRQYEHYADITPLLIDDIDAIESFHIFQAFTLDTFREYRHTEFQSLRHLAAIDTFSHGTYEPAIRSLYEY